MCVFLAVFGGTNSPSVWAAFDPVQMACLALISPPISAKICGGGSPFSTFPAEEENKV